MPGVPAESMVKRGRELVMAATDDDQPPWEESSLKGRDFYFTAAELVAAAPYEASATVYTAATTQQETVFWQSIKDSSDPEMFEAYLEQYPAGTFASLARLRVKQFEEKQAAAVMRQVAEAEALRVAAEAEARRLAEAEAEVQRLAAEAETRRLAEAQEAQRLEVERNALKETQTALLSVPTVSSLVVDNNEIERAARPQAVIKQYLNRKTVTTADWALNVMEMLNVDYLSVKSISGTTFIVDIAYQWKEERFDRRAGFATSEIEKTADSYKIISFDRKR